MHRPTTDTRQEREPDVIAEAASTSLVRQTSIAGALAATIAAVATTESVADRAVSALTLGLAAAFVVVVFTVWGLIPTSVPSAGAVGIAVGAVSAVADRLGGEPFNEPASAALAWSAVLAVLLMATARDRETIRDADLLVGLYAVGAFGVGVLQSIPAIDVPGWPEVVRAAALAGLAYAVVAALPRTGSPIASGAIGLVTGAVAVTIELIDDPSGALGWWVVMAAMAIATIGWTAFATRPSLAVASVVATVVVAITAGAAAGPRSVLVLVVAGLHLTLDRPRARVIGHRRDDVATTRGPAPVTAAPLSPLPRAAEPDDPFGGFEPMSFRREQAEVETTAADPFIDELWGASAAETIERQRRADLRAARANRPTDPPTDAGARDGG